MNPQEPQPKALLLNREQITLLASPVKRDLVETLLKKERASINELANHLGRSPKSLYYHMNQLCEVGLVQVATTRKVATRVEAVYALVATRFIIEDEEGNSEAKEAQRRSFKALLRSVEREVARAEEAGEPVELSILRADLRLSESDMQEFQRRLQEALFFARQHESKEGVHLMLTTILVTEKAPPKAKRGAG